MLPHKTVNGGNRLYWEDDIIQKIQTDPAWRHDILNVLNVSFDNWYPISVTCQTNQYLQAEI